MRSVNVVPIVSEFHRTESDAQLLSRPGQNADPASHESAAPEIISIAVLILVLIASGLAGHLRAQARKVARVRLATDLLCTEARDQRDRLVAAIEAYKADRGFYPPDHVLSEHPVVVDPVTNSLLYELLGTFHNLTNDTFIAPHFASVRGSLVREMFGAGAFRNSSDRPESVRCFLDPVTVRTTYAARRDPDPVGLLAVWPRCAGMQAEQFQDFELSSWRYICTAPRHNPGSFDLWLEIRTADTNVVVKNW